MLYPFTFIFPLFPPEHILLDADGMLGAFGAPLGVDLPVRILDDALI